MNENLKPKSNIISQSINGYQPLFLYRPKDKEYWVKKRKEGLTQCYLKGKGELIPWEGEKILKVFDNVTLNIKDDTFKSKFKKMRVAKRAPNKWRLFFTTERIVATIPYGKTLKIGDIVDLFTTTFKRQSHKKHYIVAHFPHSMLAGIVLRLKQGKPNCEHIAFVYKNKLKNRIVNYTLYFFNYGSQKQSEEFCLKFKNSACKLQLKLLKLVKDLSLLSQAEVSRIRSEITRNLDKKDFDMRENREKFKDITIKTLYIGGIPLPIFPRITS
ncbi:MAG: hypothetical protein HWN81_19970 [Candidatus Lokiarchaeota archaeon]|nr:hypothetical protein [Candidatus Lokiarchaeota archaeon]